MIKLTEDITIGVWNLDGKLNQIDIEFTMKDMHISIFQSYDKVIVKKIHNKVYLDECYWNYSRTTGKCRSIFLGETIKETRKKIKDGTYILTKLN